MKTMFVTTTYTGGTYRAVLRDRAMKPVGITCTCTVDHRPAAVACMQKFRAGLKDADLVSEGELGGVLDDLAKQFQNKAKVTTQVWAFDAGAGS